ncbi:unnamed protein product [Brassica oleracea]
MRKKKVIGSPLNQLIPFPRGDYTVAVSQNASSPIGDLRRFLRRSLTVCFLLQVSFGVLVRNLLKSIIEECG